MIYTKDGSSFVCLIRQALPVIDFKIDVFLSLRISNKILNMVRPTFDQIDKTEQFPCLGLDHIYFNG